MGNEAAGADRPAILRSRDQDHLRHRFIGNLAEVHKRSSGKPYRFQTHFEVGVSVEVIPVFGAREAEVGGPEDHDRHAVVDQGTLDAFHDIAGAPRGQERPAHGTLRVLEQQRHRGMMARDAIDARIAGIAHLAPGRGNLRQRYFSRVEHVDADRGHSVLGGDEAPFDCRGCGRREDVAAALRIGHHGPVDEDLQEEIVDVGIRP